MCATHITYGLCNKIAGQCTAAACDVMHAALLTSLCLLLAGTAPPPTVLSRLAAAAVAASYSGSSAAAAAAAAASRNTFAAWAERVQSDPRAAAERVSLTVAGKSCAAVVLLVVLRC